MGFPGGSALEKPPTDAVDMFDTCVGKIPGEGNGKPLQYSCQEIPWTEEHGGL